MGIWSQCLMLVYQSRDWDITLWPNYKGFFKSLFLFVFKFIFILVSYNTSWPQLPTPPPMCPHLLFFLYPITLFPFKIEQASEGQQPNMTKQNTIRQNKSSSLLCGVGGINPLWVVTPMGRGVWEIEGWVLWPAGEQYSLLSALAPLLALFGEIC